MTDARAQTLPFLVSLAALGGLWSVAARWGADPSVLPSPLEVWHIFASEVSKGEWQGHMVATLGRVAAAFFLAMCIGSGLGIAMGASDRLNAWLSSWLTVLLNVPALVVIVLCYLWIGLNDVAAVVAVALNKTAMVAVTIREGMWARDRALKDMAQVFDMRRGAYAVHVLLPQLWPFFAAAMRNGVAIIWKIVLVVEFLGRSNGIGFQIHLYFQLFETGYVLAYALSFTAFMLVVDHWMIGGLERRVSKWRVQGV